MQNYWDIALLLSLIIHIILFASLGFFSFPPRLVKKEPQLKEIRIIPRIIPQKRYLQQHRLTKLDTTETAKPPPYVNKLTHVDIKPAEDLNLQKTPVVENNLKSTLTASFPSEKVLKKNPSYMNYYNLIREKIRKNAYEYYSGKENGEVLLTFVILRDGKLSGIYTEEESIKNNELAKIALKSIKDASPFPPFPPSLPYPRLKFNISIYFKSN